MFKIDKNTHLAILFTFAVIFIVFYLYHTIQDLKKVQNELTKINNDILTLKRNSAVIDRLENDRLSREINKNQVNINKLNNNPNTIIYTTNETETEKDETHNLQEDNESVQTKELEDILNNSSSSSSDTESVSENDNLEVSKNAHIEIEEENEEVEEIEKIDLHSLTLEELKELCKKHGLSTKGSKSVLKERLNEIQI